jgi:uncharacterized protein YecE (DUF72 family)
MAGTFVGTCSWKYPSWAGLVYSRAAGINYLAEYAARYPTVEVDQWFWTLPEIPVAAEYAAAAPEDFRFTIKLPNALSLTHFYRKKGDTQLRPNQEFLSPAVFEDVLTRLAPLHTRIGMLMLQFEYMNAEKIPSEAEFLDRLATFLDSIPRALPLGVEIRNPQWLDTRYFTLLAEKRVSHVFLQGYFMPPIARTFRRFGGLLTDSSVVRLHGPDRGGIEKVTGESWNRIVAPKDDELSAVVDMINDMRGRSMTVYLNVNNHYEGSAPLTIERLRERGIRECPPVMGQPPPPGDGGTVRPF